MLKKNKSSLGFGNSRHRNAIEALEGRQFFSAAAAPRGGADVITSSRQMIDNGGVLPPGRAGHGGGDYQINNRWTQTATNGFTGSSSDPITLTWGFVADGLNIPAAGGISTEVAAPSILQARLTTLYGTMAAAQAVFQQVFDRWSAVSGITYVYTGLSDDGAPFISSPGVLGVRPDVRIGGHHLDGSSNVLAYNFFPDVSDMVIDTDDLTGSGYMTNLTASSRRLRNVVAHEHGHGLGLSHVDPINQTKLMEAFVSTAYDGPQYDDILAIQTLYGDPLEKNGRNDTTATATDKGTPALGTSTLATGVSVSTSDIDNFKISLTSDRTVALTLSPVGTTYSQGSQGGGLSDFASGSQADLVVSVYAANGTTVIATQNATGLGASESTTLNLPAGNYFVRVSVNGSGSTQMYSLTANVTALVVQPPAPPSTPALTFASDSGSSHTDNITKVKNAYVLRHGRGADEHLDFVRWRRGRLVGIRLGWQLVRRHEYARRRRTRDHRSCLEQRWRERTVGPGECHDRYTSADPRHRV